VDTPNAELNHYLKIKGVNIDMVWTVNHFRTIAVIKAAVKEVFNVSEESATLFATELVEKLEEEKLIST
jgi:hypothetical protein